jgi:beta-phosphoglucomutase-like phosphatase (HAD superfamily)
LRLIRPFDVTAVTAVLCDADGNLFPSEAPAFAASVEVTNQFLRHFGIARRYTAEELRVSTTGKNFRTTAVDLAVAWGVPIDSELADGRPDVGETSPAPSGRMLTASELETWVARERDEVTAHLRRVLSPDPGVLTPLRRLSSQCRLAAVSSSALMRLRACFEVTGVAGLIPADNVFSAEDSLPVPTSKPDPAVYRLAVDALGIDAGEAVAVEDSVPGVASAVAAGVPTIGNVMFVPPDERSDRLAELAAAGACAVTDSWFDIAASLSSASASTGVRSRHTGRVAESQA